MAMERLRSVGARGQPLVSAGRIAIRQAEIQAGTEGWRRGLLRPRLAPTPDEIRARLERSPLADPGQLVREGCATNDLAVFEARLRTLAKARGFRLRSLGLAFGHQILIAERPSPIRGAPKRLIATGLHGEEPGGPWGLLRFMEDAPDRVLDAAHLTLLPMINPTGFIA